MYRYHPAIYLLCSRGKKMVGSFQTPRLATVAKKTTSKTSSREKISCPTSKKLSVSRVVPMLSLNTIIALVLLLILFFMFFSISFAINFGVKKSPCMNQNPDKVNKKKKNRTNSLRSLMLASGSGGYVGSPSM